MFNQDKLITGIILGTIIPFVGYALLIILFEQISSGENATDATFSDDFHLRTRALIAISLNLIPFIFFNRRRFINVMRGLVFPTMVYVIAWFFVYGRHLVGL